MLSPAPSRRYHSSQRAPDYVPSSASPIVNGLFLAGLHSANDQRMFHVKPELKPAEMAYLHWSKWVGGVVLHADGANRPMDGTRTIWLDLPHRAMSQDCYEMGQIGADSDTLHYWKQSDAVDVDREQVDLFIVEDAVNTRHPHPPLSKRPRNRPFLVTRVDRRCSLFSHPADSLLRHSAGQPTAEDSKLRELVAMYMKLRRWPISRGRGRFNVQVELGDQSLDETLVNVDPLLPEFANWWVNEAPKAAKWITSVSSKGS